MANPSAETRTPKPRPRFRFSIGALMLTMLACCVAAAGASYFLRAAKVAEQYEAREAELADEAAKGIAPATIPKEPLAPPPIALYIIPLAAPAIVVVLISTAHRLLVWMNRPQKQKR